MADRSRALGVGVVGAGDIMKRHALAFRAAGARLVAVADIDRKRADAARKQHGFAVATDDPAALFANPDVDVVAICTRPNTHARLTIDALAAGKHVLCEKPIAPTLAEADDVIAAAARRPDLVVSFVYQWRLDPAVQMVRGLLERDELGRPLMAEAHVRTVRNDAYYKPAARRESWELDGGGVLVVVAIHQLDLLLAMLHEPVEASAQMATFQKPTEGEDTLVGWIRFRNGALATIESTVCGQEDTFSVELLGAKARARLVRPQGSRGCRWEVVTRNRALRKSLEAVGRREAPPETFEPGPKTIKLLERLGKLRRKPYVAPAQWSHRASVAAFVDAVRSSGPSPMSPAEARRSLELTVGLYHAARSGRVVRFPLDRTFPDYHGIRTDEDVRAARGG
jgi:UDP-N-acetyl-2-amino-2-deoxyglucuronate dehydrogenase